MRKSGSVILGLLAMAMLTGCEDDGQTEVKSCVDKSGRIVDDKNCDSQGAVGAHGIYPYRYVYGGRSGGSIGDTVVGAHLTPSVGATHISPSVSRGGFGGGFHGGFGA